MSSVNNIQKCMIFTAVYGRSANPLPLFKSFVKLYIYGVLYIKAFLTTSNINKTYVLKAIKAFIYAEKYAQRISAHLSHFLNPKLCWNCAKILESRAAVRRRLVTLLKLKSVTNEIVYNNFYAICWTFMPFKHYELSTFHIRYFQTI